MIQIAGYVTIELTLLATAPGLGPSATASVGIGGRPLQACSRRDVDGNRYSVADAHPCSRWRRLGLGGSCIPEGGSGRSHPWRRRSGGLHGGRHCRPPALFGSGVEFAPELALAFGLYFPFLVWDQFNAYSLAGLGSPIPAGSVLAFQAGIALVLALKSQSRTRTSGGTTGYVFFVDRDECVDTAFPRVAIASRGDADHRAVDPMSSYITIEIAGGPP